MQYVSTLGFKGKRINDLDTDYVRCLKLEAKTTNDASIFQHSCSPQVGTERRGAGASSSTYSRIHEILLSTN